jgi:hypothetical protein
MAGNGRRRAARHRSRTRKRLDDIIARAKADRPDLVFTTLPARWAWHSPPLDEETAAIAFVLVHRADEATVVDLSFHRNRMLKAQNAVFNPQTRGVRGAQTGTHFLVCVCLFVLTPKRTRRTMCAFVPLVLFERPACGKRR